MVRGLRCLAALALLVACEPDDFRYAADGEGSCRDDSCPSDAAASCSETWSAPFDGALARALLVDEGSVFVVGELERDGRAPVAWLGKNARCLGSSEAAATQSTYASSLGGAVRSANGVVVAGTLRAEKLPSRGFVSELDPAMLTSGWSETLPDDHAVLSSVARSPGGVWAVGASSLELSPRALAVKTIPGQASCSFGFGATPTELTAVAVEASDVYVVGREASAIALFRFDDAACDVVACNCQPARSLSGILPPAALDAEPRSLLVQAGTAYIAGLSAGHGFVLAVQAETGAVTGFFDFDPSAEPDELLALASDGKRLYVGGARGASDHPVAVLGAIELPLIGGAQPTWWVEIGGAERVTALSVESEGSFVYAGVSRPGGSVLVRCTASGACPALE